MTIAGFMRAASVGGQLTLLAALQRGIPRHVMFPLANGGGLSWLHSWVLFGERIHLYGIAGIVLGIAATVLLSLPWCFALERIGMKLLLFPNIRGD